MERRAKGSGQVMRVACRSCGAPVLLDPAGMRPGTDGPGLACPMCGVWMAVRRADPERASVAAPPGSAPEPVAASVVSGAGPVRVVPRRRFHQRGRS